MGKSQKKKQKKYTNQCDDVSGRHGKNVSAGDLVLATWDCIHRCFRFDHGVEPVSRQRQIVRVILLRLVAST